MNQLKNKIQNQRHLLDEENPSNGHEARFLDKLDQELHQKPTKGIWLKIAASLIIVLGVSLVLKQLNQNDNAPVEFTQHEEESVIPIDQAEYYYEQSFNTQFDAIAKNYTDKESLAMIKESEVLIGNLQQEYLALENELKISGDERVATAMILNYKSRIGILEKLIEKLEYVNRIKHQTNEKLNS